jgi:hypothetical protein
MTQPQGNSLRELIEEARQLRRGQQPPAALVEATLERLAREEREPALQLSRRLTLVRALQSVPRWLCRLGLPRLAAAFVLALAVLVGWRALFPRAPEGQPVAPVAIAPEPPLTAERQELSLAPGAASPLPPVSPALPAPEPLPPQTKRAPAAKEAAKRAGSPDTSCEPPWFSDAEGVLRMKPGCSSPAGNEKAAPDRKARKLGKARPERAAPGCEPPWFTDSGGIRRLKPKCL